jgi:hypothetical protein
MPYLDADGRRCWLVRPEDVEVIVPGAWRRPRAAVPGRRPARRARPRAPRRAARRVAACRAAPDDPDPEPARGAAGRAGRPLLLAGAREPLRADGALVPGAERGARS